MDRDKFIFLAIALAFILLIFGVFNLNIIQGNSFKRLSDSNCIRLIPQEGCRGNILDREGSIIVDNKLSYDLMLLPQEVGELNKVLSPIAKILGVGVDKLSKAFKSGYISSSVPVTIASNIELKKAVVLGEYKVQEPSIVIQPRPQRHYPYVNLASHVLGYVNEIDRWRLTKLEDYGYKTKDLVGFGGVEEKYDYYLRQEEGGLSVEVNHRGKFMRVLGFAPPVNGKDIQLTLDLKIQKIVEEKMADRKGSVVIINPYSGEVLAMASFPNFNPDLFIRRKNTEIAALFSNSDAPLLNRAISAAYPPASVFKVVVASCALESKKINRLTSFFCPGFTYVGKRKFSCWNAHGWQDLIQALAHSCDVFFYRAGLLVGPQNIHDYALKLGLGRSVNFELPYEVSGFIPTPLWRKLNRFQSWFNGDTANLSIGQGECLATPLQVACMMAVFANNGYLPTPYIVKNIGGLDVGRRKMKLTRVGLKKNTMDSLRFGLRQVVSDEKGTGNVLSGLGVEVAGKTGTAQTTRAETHAWFAGFFPYELPRYAICVFLENGGPGYAACVITKQIIEAMIKEGLL